MMIIDRDSLVEYVAQKTDDSKNSFFVDLIVTGILHDDHPQYETDWSEFLGNLDLTYYIDAAKQTYHIAVMDDATGNWDVQQTFEAIDDADATKHAEKNFAHLDWYVLDYEKNNIHSGERVSPVGFYSRKYGKS